ncbi:Maternal DNA replication licensing factor mcm3 [Dictyocoela muelleri]|nr:Maternal DNA replication licensing factor mcm3 [Dictyocoela muelleri]
MDTSETFRSYLENTFEGYMPSDRLIFDLDDMRNFNKPLVNEIINEPLVHIPLIEDELWKLHNRKIFFGASGCLGDHLLTPRTINVSYLGKLVAIEGIVTSCSAVRPKLSMSVHFSKVKQVFYEKEYRDSTMITRLPPTSYIYPKKDPEGNNLTTEYGLSEFYDYQTINLQEMPEKAPAGQLPRSIEVILTNDLVDRIKPGDRVRIYGVYKSITPNNVFPTHFKTIVLANNLTLLRQDMGSYDLEILEDEEEKFQKFLDLLKSADILERMVEFVAPSIYGHNKIKKALILQLVGGNEVNMENGSRIRGDINILLIGDPSTAKSQLLRFVMNISPLAISTTGKGSSGVGLTAAVVIDKDTGEKRLEAGAMVIADRGIVCIDEFDKMNEGDRVAIHEVMEQQTVTISKAGIHTTLNARCSVLAAANPVFGQYRDNLKPQENILLSETILTRFDLIFITRDNLNSEEDEKIAKHVLNNRQDSYDKNQLFMKRYIATCKELKPTLTAEACNLITQHYVMARQKTKTLVSVTPRVLETLIRLSTAHAKLRQSEFVEIIDVNTILKLMDYEEQDETIKRLKIDEKENILNVQEFPPGLDSVYDIVKICLSEIHKSKSIIPVDELLVEDSLKNFRHEEILKALYKLDGEELIVFDGENVIFLD